VEAAGIVRITQQLEAAKKLIDWSVTEAANQLYHGGFAIVAIPGMAKAVKHYPEGMAKAMIDNDFSWAALHRQALLAEWQKRDDLKSVKK
jgi:iron(III) transport system substrate-binding protein